MKLPVMGVARDSCCHFAGAAPRGKSFCVSQTEALLTTALLARMTSCLPCLLFLLASRTPTAFPPGKDIHSRVTTAKDGNQISDRHY